MANRGRENLAYELQRAHEEVNSTPEKIQSNRLSISVVRLAYFAILHDARYAFRSTGHPATNTHCRLARQFHGMFINSGILDATYLAIRRYARYQQEKVEYKPLAGEPERETIEEPMELAEQVLRSISILGMRKEEAYVR